MGCWTQRVGERSLERNAQEREESEGCFVFKAGFYLNANFTSLDMGFVEISRSRFKQSKNASFIT